MMRRANDVASNARAGFALAVANLRYWPTVAPQVRRELRQWQQLAETIPDPVLRRHALAKLRDEHFNAQVAATLATLTSRPHRAHVVSAIVAFQIMYDYLDGVSEQPVADPRRNGQQLYRAFAVALTPGAPPSNYYRHHPQRLDGGYLDQLVLTCRDALETLPSAQAVVAVARRVAARCAEAQTLAHAIPLHGTAPLRRWGTARAGGTGLTWWELAAGAAASSLTVHALLAAAAHPTTTVGDAVEIASAYLSICALSTLLDSLADHDRDIRDGSHRYVAYYADNAIACERISAIARSARGGVRGLRNAPHHAMTVAGVAGYYLTAPGATTDVAKAVATRVTDELRPLIAPVIVIFRAWRAAQRIRIRRTEPGEPACTSRRRPRTSRATRGSPSGWSGAGARVRPPASRRRRLSA
jgi:tetraprenyl-beta-curcumene synthase